MFSRSDHEKEGDRNLVRRKGDIEKIRRKINREK